MSVVLAPSAERRKRTDRIEIFRDKAGEWRWRFRRGGNGKVMADSGEGYKRRAACVKAAEYLAGLWVAEWVEVES